MMARKNNTSLVNSTVLYVGQIPYDWNENIIKSVVCGSGNVVDVRLGFDYAGKNKGFCFVEYQSPQDAQKALPLLGQIKLLQPNAKGQYKKLRIELSKEGLRSNAPSDVKPVLQLDRNNLPGYVQLPPEMLYNGPPIPQNNGNMGSNMLFMSPGVQPMNTMNNQPFQPPFQLPGFQQPQSFAGGINNVSNQTLSNAVQASLGIAAPADPQLTISSKIDENLSKIPPALLVDLISNLKTILSGPNASRAVEVFRISPDLATTAAQALLLMGFIDSDVIADSMKSVSETSPPSKPSDIPPKPVLPQVASAPGAPNMHDNSSGYASTPPMGNSSKWPHLPPSAVAKLSALSPDQANLIAQVLSLPADQISSLPPEQQAMVTNLRAQYL